MSTTEEPQKLYAAREPVFPKRVKGTFRNLKWIIMIVTLGIYYVTPWIRFDRGPNLPDQAVLLDLANRRFFFFWIEIWPHEFYFVAGLLIMAGSASSCSPRRSAGSGAAIPVRRRSGPTSSSPWSAGSRATATRG
jgi:hypothetical protein